jgi:hypothetical protein
VFAEVVLFERTRAQRELRSGKTWDEA